ncbi:MAG: ribonuclease P protein component [Thermoguttaceae bacterium]
MPDFSLKKTDRIRKQDEFQKIYKLRRSVSDSFLILYVFPNGLSKTRLGMSVSRKVGNAVVRNKWKRLIREQFRLNKHTLPVGFDFLFIPKPKTAPIPFQRVGLSLRKLIERVMKKFFSDT